MGQITYDCLKPDAHEVAWAYRERLRASPPKFLSPREVSIVANWSDRTTDRLLSEPGGLPSAKVGRRRIIRLIDLEKFLASRIV